MKQTVIDVACPKCHAKPGSYCMGVLRAHRRRYEECAKSNMTDAERKVYEYYYEGGTRGDLYKHYKCGLVGIQKPDRTQEYAYSAWLAGKDRREVNRGIRQLRRF